MSVLIKGMKLPANENETIIRIQPNGTILDQYGHHLIIKAVPVPPHGRLIDADALLQRAVPHGWSTPKWVSDIAIDDAPTIIPAEETAKKDRRLNE